MQNSTPNNDLKMINLAGFGALVLLVTCTAVFGVGKLIKSGHDTQARSAKIQQDLQELDGLSKTLEQFDTDKKHDEARLADAENRLPTSQAMDEFMHQLAKVAEDAGLQVDSTIPNKTIEDAGGYKCVPVTITGTGSWMTCYKFLTGLRSMQRLTRLDSVSLEADKKFDGSTASDAGLSSLCRITVEISTFMAR